jgi:pyrimidine deaminase RibD-like protein
VAVFALSAVAVSSAFAAPAFWNCKANAAGVWAAGCKAAGTGFEKEKLGAGVKVTFTSSSGEGHMKTKIGEVKCTADSGSGETNGPTAVAAVVTKFTKCKSSGFACKTKGAAAEEVVTNSLHGELVWLKAGAAKPAGLLLEPPTGSEFTKGEIECAGGIIKAKVTGSVIGVVTPEGVMQTTGELIYKESAPEVQEWQQVEEAGVEHHLIVGGSAAGLESKETITFAEAVEVK